jgi:hypothetical protein
VYSRPLSTNQPTDWVDMNCCLPRQNCLDRKGEKEYNLSECSSSLHCSLLRLSLRPLIPSFTHTILDWVSMKTNKVPIVNIFGLQVALGERYLTVPQPLFPSYASVDLGLIFSSFMPLTLHIQISSSRIGNVNFHTEHYRPCVLNELGNLTHCP